MNRDSFSQELKDKYDKMGKDGVQRYYAERNLTAIPNPISEFIIDMHVYDDDDKLVAYAEAEVRPGWTSRRFPWDTVHVPFRKKKYFNEDVPSFYFAFNHDASIACVIDKTDILKSNFGLSDNKYQNKELFFKVPLHKTTLVKIKKEI